MADEYHQGLLIKDPKWICPIYLDLSLAQRKTSFEEESIKKNEKKGFDEHTLCQKPSDEELKKGEVIT